MKIKKIFASALAAVIAFGSAMTCAVYAASGEDTFTSEIESNSSGNNSEPGNDNGDSNSDITDEDSGNTGEGDEADLDKEISIIVSDVINGTVTVDKTTVKAGEKLRVDAVATEGYLVAISVVVYNENFNPEWIVDREFTDGEGYHTLKSGYLEVEIPTDKPSISYVRVSAVLGTPIGSITVEEVPNGTVKVVTPPNDTMSGTYYNEGTLVEIATEPDDGYELETIKVTDSKGQTVSPNADGYYKIPPSPNCNLFVTATFKKISDTSTGDTENSTPETSNPETSDPETGDGNTVTRDPVIVPPPSTENSGTTSDTEQVIEGGAEVTPGTDTTVKTDAGDITVTTDKDDTALENTTFVVDTVTDTDNVFEDFLGDYPTDSTKEMIAEAEKAVADGYAVILDLSFEKDNVKVQPDKSVTITLPVPAELKGAGKIFVYHASKGSITFVAAPDVIDGKITFTADKFSPYIFSKVELKTVGGSSVDASNPGDGSNPNTGIGYAFIPAMIAAGAVIASFKKRK